jgi:hypothetical protein
MLISVRLNLIVADSFLCTEFDAFMTIRFFSSYKPFVIRWQLFCTDERDKHTLRPIAFADANAEDELFSYEPLFQEIDALQVTFTGKFVHVEAGEDCEFFGIILHLHVRSCIDSFSSVYIVEDVLICKVRLDCAAGN